MGDYLYIFIIIVIIPLLIKEFLAKTEKQINKKTQGLYKKGIIVILGREHYKFLKPLSIITLLLMILIHWKLQNPVWLILLLTSFVGTVLIFLEQAKFSLVLLALLALFSLLSMGINLPIPYISEFFKHGYDNSGKMPPGMLPLLLSMTMIIFNLGVLENPKDLLKGNTTRPLTSMEKAAVRKRIKRSRSR